MTNTPMSVEELFRSLDNPAPADDPTTMLDSAEAWRPEQAGDQIGGVITRISHTASEYVAERIPVVDLLCPDATVRQIRAYHSVLRRELNDRHVEVGGTLAVRYLGETATKDGKRRFHGYKVAYRAS
jgi:hypothetical protein